jgi:soluble lytic murein transglycosylase-like protein
MDQQIISLLTQAANQYGLPPALVIAQAQQESGGNPNAVSPAGAQGVMQLMPATAAQLGVTNPFDAAQNIDAGVRYLSQLLTQFGGNIDLALAAYNWGPGNVSKNGFDNWPQETQDYVNSIMMQYNLSQTEDEETEEEG